MKADEGDCKKVSGVAVGVVTNNKDEGKLGRVKVKFPWLSDDNETDWVRVSTFMAGPDMGGFFLPNVGDEVLVAFEQGNLNCPYVIGALWNGKAKPPETNSDGKNNIRKIKSRSGHELIFNDEKGKERIEIHTKAGHKIILDDTNGKERVEISDQSGDNSILIDFTKNSIAITSKAKFSINSETIEIHATKEMTINSDRILNINGNQVKINCDS